jgi:hypothetical protein
MTSNVSLPNLGTPYLETFRLSPTTDLLFFEPSKWPLGQFTASGLSHLLIGQRACALSHFRYETCLMDIANNFKIADASTTLNQFSLLREDPDANCTDVEYRYASWEAMPHVDPVPVELNVADVRREGCRWVPSRLTAQFTQMRTVGDAGTPIPTDGQGREATTTGPVYAVEVCLTHRDCDPSTFICTNVFAALALHSTMVFDPTESTVAGFLTESDQVFTPISWPPGGSGDVGDVLRMDPRSGPYRPCPVLADGRQAACGEGEDESGGLLPVDVLTLHVSKFELSKVLSADVEHGAFTVRFKFRVAWSDRHATHPCTISLYAYGRGIPKGNAGLKVNASSWWVPKPGGDAPANIKTEHAAKLDVLSAPGAPVISPCTDCPFPMQLFLQDQVTVTATYNFDFDLRKFPFDKHLFRAELQIADNFASDDANYTLLTSEIEQGRIIAAAKGLSSGSDFTVVGFAYSVEGRSVVVDIRLERKEASMKAMRCVLPMVGNMFLVVLASATRGSARVKFLSLSLLAAILMLDGKSFGLPSSFGGVPLVMSLVMVHIGIATIILAVSCFEAESQWRTKKKHILPGMWDETVAARARWEHGLALIAPHRARAFEDAGIRVDPEEVAGKGNIWPTKLGSCRNVPVVMASGSRGHPHPTDTKGVHEADKPAAVADPPVVDAMNDKVDKIVAMMSVLPDLMARASKEPITPVEPDSYFRDYVRGEKIEKMLRYTVPSTYVLAWAILSAVYMAEPDPW